MTPEENMTGKTRDISNFCQYQWYQWVKSYEIVSYFPHDKKCWRGILSLRLEFAVGRLKNC